MWHGSFSVDVDVCMSSKWVICENWNLWVRSWDEVASHFYNDSRVAGIFLIKIPQMEVDYGARHDPILLNSI